jgi:hypothetical protein
MNRPDARAADFGDFVVVLLAGTLAGLRDRLAAQEFDRAAEFVADLVDVTDAYLGEAQEPKPQPGGVARPDRWRAGH